MNLKESPRNWVVYAWILQGSESLAPKKPAKKQTFRRPEIWDPWPKRRVKGCSIFLFSTSIFMTWFIPSIPLWHSMKYLLFSRDPYNSLWNNPNKAGWYNPLIPSTTRGPFFSLVHLGAGGLTSEEMTRVFWICFDGSEIWAISNKKEQLTVSGEPWRGSLGF